MSTETDMGIHVTELYTDAVPKIYNMLTVLCAHLLMNNTVLSLTEVYWLNVTVHCSISLQCGVLNCCTVV